MFHVSEKIFCSAFFFDFWTLKITEFNKMTISVMHSYSILNFCVFSFCRDQINLSYSRYPTKIGFFDMNQTSADVVPLQLVVMWLEHDCRYQYTEDLLQHVRYGLMDVPTLRHLARSHALVQSSPTVAALVEEALDYHHATFAQPLHQSDRTRPRFQSLTLYIVGGRKREVSRVRELRYFNPSAQEHVRVAGGSNWSELAPMPTGRSHHCVAVMGNFLFVVGGEVEHATGRTCAVRTACRYDPRGNCWTEIAPMKACREHFVLGALGQYLYAVGGRNELRQVLPSVERYCPERNKWMFVQPFDRSLSCHAGCVADDLLWISGRDTPPQARRAPPKRLSERCPSVLQVGSQTQLSTRTG